MAGPSIAVRVLGDLTGLGKSLGDAGSKAQGAAAQGKAAFQTFLGSINATGVLGPLGGMLDQVSQGIDQIAAHGKSIGPVMVGAGAAITGLGAGMSAFGSKEQAAHQQLQQAIENTGNAYDDYGQAIEGAIKHGENYGHTADETQTALQRLTEATHDPQKALDLLSTAEDVAAARHIDLSTAATNVGKVYNGNTKLLKQFGIQLDATTGLTKDGKTATQALADVTKGQAAAATDTFAGKLDALKAKITDSVAQFSQKYGPAVQMAGIAVMTLGTIWSTVGPLMGAMTSIALGPIGLIVLGIAGLIAAAYLLWRNWDTIWGGIQAAVGAVWDWISTHWPLLLDILLGPIGVAVNLIIANWQHLADVISWVWNNVLKPVWDALAGAWSWIWDNVLHPGFEATKQMWSDIGGAISWVWNNVIKPAWDALSAAWSWIWDNVLHPGFEATKQMWSDIGGAIAWVVDNVMKPAFNGVKTAVQAVVDAIRGAFNILINGWNHLHFKMPSFDTHIPGVGTIGGFDVGLPTIPPLAQGGLITASGLVYAHAGEAITPWPPSPAVTIQNATFGDQVDVDVFMQRVAWNMQRQRV